MVEQVFAYLQLFVGAMREGKDGPSPPIVYEERWFLLKPASRSDTSSIRIRIIDSYKITLRIQSALVARFARAFSFMSSTSLSGLSARISLLFDNLT